MKKKTILDVIHEDYNLETNMTIKELRVWNNDPLSKKVSKNTRPLAMAIQLRGKQKDRWDLNDARWALYNAIPFLKRSEKIKKSKILKSGYTRNQMSLKNWGFDIRKSFIIRRVEW